MTDVMKTQHGSIITLFMEVPVEAVHKLVSYAFYCVNVSVNFPHQGIDPLVY